jgi:hypothetical protein
VLLRGQKLPSPFAFNLVAVGATDVVMMDDRKALIRRMHERVMALLEQREGRMSRREGEVPGGLHAKAPMPAPVEPAGRRGGPLARLAEKARRQGAAKAKAVKAAAPPRPAGPRPAAKKAAVRPAKAKVKRAHK